MKIKNVFRLTGVLISLLFFTYQAFADKKQLAEGNKLPEIILSVPKNTEHQKYLGITRKGTFNIPQIKAEVVIIEIFSMYCPHCQREAPTINKFYEELVVKCQDIDDPSLTVKSVRTSMTREIF